MSDKKKSLLSYDLCGIVYHYGSLRGGHYKAACKNSDDNMWYKYNDSYVSVENNPQSLVTADAYVLLYKRKDLTKTALSLEELKKVAKMTK
jgi:ubiquitin carboxyl-terminal hydrolase 4/11/15